MVTSQSQKRWIVWGAALLGIITVVMWPVTTRFGIDYHVSSKRITFGEKAIHFLSRDLQARRLATEITSGSSTYQERLSKILDWTVLHVQPTPPGFPVVDDHVMHIIIRGYGASDQRTEVFALLASYAGFRTAVTTLKVPGTEQGLIVAVVRDGAKTYLFDVVHHLTFRDDTGALMEVDQLSRHPQLVDRIANGLVVNGVPYAEYLRGASALRLKFARMEAQKPWPRLWQEIGHFFGIRTE